MNNNSKKAESSPGKLAPLSLGEGVGGEVLNIGIVGAGGFAAFAVKNFLQVPGVKIIAVTDTNPAVAEKLATENDAKVYTDLEAFLNAENIDLVYIATPPFLHYEQSKSALLAGKHVICEKPAALKTSEAEELSSLATSNKLLYVVNLMQRYNPLYDVVDKIVKEKTLGNFLHGFFENYASDETLDTDHWFWNEEKSGGIFIEHGVHFFDMFSGWLGEGKVVNAIQMQAPESKGKMIDRAQATVLYKEGTVNFYHGFDQPDILDRQEMRLQFERGEITLYEWVPVKMKLHGLVKDEQLKYLQEMLPGASVIYHNQAQQGNQKTKGRFAEINFDKEVTLEYGNATEKQNRYERLIISMLTDQWNWIKNNNHKRIIDSNNAVESLRIAEQAKNIAQNF